MWTVDLTTEHGLIAKGRNALHLGDETRFRAIAIVLRVLCIIPFLTGLADLFGGAAFLRTAGAKLSDASISDAALNNQIKFWGVIWFGYGLSLWWASSDPRARSGLIYILLGTLFCSGLGRALAVYEYGWAAPVLTAAMALELVSSAAMLVWLQRLRSKS